MKISTETSQSNITIYLDELHLDDEVEISDDIDIDLVKQELLEQCVLLLANSDNHTMGDFQKDRLTLKQLEQAFQILEKHSHQNR